MQYPQEARQGTCMEEMESAVVNNNIKATEETVANAEEVVANVDESVAKTEEIAAKAEVGLTIIEEAVTNTKETVANTDDAVTNAKEATTNIEESVANVEEPVTITEDSTAKSVKHSQEEDHDPYFYTKTNEFTSEVFKIEVGGLQARFCYAQLKNLLNKKLKLKTHKLKSMGRRAFITFRCEEDREKALQTLNNYLWNGNTLTAKKANPAADPYIKKRKQMADSEGEKNSKKQKQDSTEDVDVNTQLKNAVMPLWNMPYEDQLEKKCQDMKKFLVKLGREIEKSHNKIKLPEWLQKNRTQNNFMCCPLSGVRPSPIIDGYRNKCEFTVAMDKDGCEKTVGFRLAKYSAGSMCVVSPSDCNIVRKSVIQIVQVFQDFVRKSNLEAFNPEKHSGHWQQLTVRCNRNDDALLIVVMHPQKLTQEELQAVKSELKSYFWEGPGKSCNVKGLYFQPFIKRGSLNDSTLEHVCGEEHLYETILGQRFRISPNAFFQVNSEAAEVLYAAVAELADVQPSTVLLDICCGTGTIGISLAKKVKSVIGIEMVAGAVEDAKQNALMNGLTNVTFTCGKVEDTLMSTLLRLTPDDDVLAIVDPPRAGLHTKVVQAIRRCAQIHRLVYVSCDPVAASSNFVNLCKPETNQYRGDPFNIVQAVAIDLFPHANHCELVVLLERRKRTCDRS